MVKRLTTSSFKCVKVFWFFKTIFTTIKTDESLVSLDSADSGELTACMVVKIFLKILQKPQGITTFCTAYWFNAAATV
jgi:hypothetical protein